MSDKHSQTGDIAVVGLGAMFPGRGDTAGYWRDIAEGVDTLGPVPSTHWLIEDYYDADPRARDKTYGRRGGFLSPKGFDPLEFGIPPNQIDATDTAQLLALIVAQQALDEAEAATNGKIDRKRTSCILGVASATELVGHMSGRLQRPSWVKGLRDAGLPESEVQAIADKISENFSEWKESTFPGLLGNVVAGRVANRMDLGGSNYVTDAACASSLSALHGAIHELRAGDSDLVLAGGVDTLNDILMYMCFSKTPALSPSEDCRPFSDQADGTMLGEGIGILALRRLEDAERDGNRIHAIIKGIGAGSDGRGTAIYAPLSEGQARALNRAYEQAGYDPRTVELVEAHGTGTKAGDAAEIGGLKLVFAPDGDIDQPWCAIGSVKSQIGHTKAAAGSASLVKTVMALNRRALPPTIKVDRPSRALAGSPFYANRELRPWIRANDHPRRASVSSFGFGGSNFHVTLEEYSGPQAAQPERIMPCELFMVSGDDPISLENELEAFATRLEHEEDLAIAASESQYGFDPSAPCRAAIVATDAEDYASKAGKLAWLLSSGQAETAPLPKGTSVSLTPASPGKLAFLMPGQGSQYVGMGRELALAFPEARAAWDLAASHKKTGKQRLHDLAFPSPAFTAEEAIEQADALTAMENAQPALAAASLAVLAVLSKAGLTPDTAAGHSFGEIMALHAGGVFDAKDALTLANKRAALMAKAAASNEGAMLATQAPAERLAPILESHPDVVIANDNAPTQTVLSGPVDAIEAARIAIEAAGIKARRLPVASAFHSPIVAGAVEPFRKTLEKVDFTKSAFPVYANASGKRYPMAYARQRDILATQIESPVHFRSIIEAMHGDGVTTFVEAGPGTVLTALVGQILPGKAHAIALDDKKASGLAAFLAGLGKLAVLGHPVDFQALFANMPAPAPRKARSKHAIDLNGANYKKPYPPEGGAAALPAPNPERPAIAARAQQPPHTPPPQTLPAEPPARPQPPTSTPPISRKVSSGVSPVSQSSHPVASDAAERIHANMSAAHADYMDALRAAHTQYLNASASLLGAAASGQVIEAQPQRRQLAAPPAPQAAPASNGQAYEAPAATAAAPAPPPAAPQPAPSPTPAAAAMQTAATPTPAVSAPPTTAAPLDFSATVTALVAEKTGYPADMLELDMDLEGELGVDSIKQVEILSALRESMPDLPEVEPEQIAELRTIRKIADFLAPAGFASATPAPAPMANGNGHAAPNGNGSHAPAAAAPAPAAPTGDMTDLVRNLIAEKTGYPPEMLEDDMDLEGELGVDSIKQVEILSALRETMPNLPEVEPEQIAELRSIRKIADFFQ